MVPHSSNLRANELNSPRAIHLIAEATRRAMLDRNKYLGDPDTSRIPYRDLLSEERARAWRASPRLS